MTHPAVLAEIIRARSSSVPRSPDRASSLRRGQEFRRAVVISAWMTWFLAADMRSDCRLGLLSKRETISESLIRQAWIRIFRRACRVCGCGSGDGRGGDHRRRRREDDPSSSSFSSSFSSIAFRCSEVSLAIGFNDEPRNPLNLRLTRLAGKTLNTSARSPTTPP